MKMPSAIAHQNFSKYILLGTLYVSQMIPSHFFEQAMPVIMRQRGMSLGAIAAMGLIVIPWVLKFLWSPLIDGFSFSRWGHYRFWILCFQSLLAVSLVICAFLDISSHFIATVICLFLICLFAASQDIATDALAVNLLDKKERGFGNGIQSSGQNLGRALGGGVGLIVFQTVGWMATFFSLAFFILLASIPTILHKEPTRSRSKKSKPDFRALIRFCQRPGIWRWLGIMLLYLLGRSMAGGMLRPLLVDIGLSLADIGWILGIVGFGSGIVGAMIAGLIVDRLGRKRSLIAFGLVSTSVIAAYLLLAVGITNRPIVYLICILSSVEASMIYTVLYTVIMDKSELTTAGTDYTTQTSVLFIGILLSTVIGGVIAQAMGYVTLFTFSIVLSLLGVVAIAKLFKEEGMALDS